jgi:hypothetical protein
VHGLILSLKFALSSEQQLLISQLRKTVSSPAAPLCRAQHAAPARRPHTDARIQKSLN